MGNHIVCPAPLWQSEGRECGNFASCTQEGLQRSFGSIFVFGDMLKHWYSTWCSHIGTIPVVTGAVRASSSVVDSFADVFMRSFIHDLCKQVGHQDVHKGKTSCKHGTLTVKHNSRTAPPTIKSYSV